MISIETNDKPDLNWNERLLQSSMGSVHNTEAYVTSINSQVGLPIKPIFLKFISSRGSIVGQVAIATYPRFFKQGMLKDLVKKIPGTKNKIYRWNYGPVIFNLGFEKEISNEFKKFLISKKCKVTGSEHPFREGSLENFEKPFSLKKWGTFVIDLSDNIENIWKKMHKHSAQKNIERTEKRGIYVKQMKRDDLELYRKLRIDKDLKLGYDVLAIETLQKTWDTLKGVGWTGFIAFKDEKPISGLMITFFNGFINEWGAARAEQNLSPKVYPQDLLKWEIIKWACKKKFRYYDLTGTNPNPITDKEKGIFRYKKKWGGNLVEYNLIKL